MSFLLFLQSPSPTALAAPVPERTPAILTLIYVGAFSLIVLLLVISLLRNRRRPTGGTIPDDLPRAVKRRLGSTTTNRGVRALRLLFIALALTVFGFHVYWALYASTINEKFEQLSYKDLRNRRLSQSSLRGWIYDRKGRPLAS